MITFQEVNEKDLKILANIYTITLFDLRPEENWTHYSSISYLKYFYNLQPDLFICAYDNELPIGAAFSVLKPYWDGLHLFDLQIFVSKDYQGQNIGKKLLEKHFELAISKYNVSSVHMVVQQEYLSWFQQIGLEAFYDRISLFGNIETCLKELKKLRM